MCTTNVIRFRVTNRSIFSDAIILKTYIKTYRSFYYTTKRTEIIVALYTVCVLYHIEFGPERLRRVLETHSRFNCYIIREMILYFIKPLHCVFARGAAKSRPYVINRVWMSKKCSNQPSHFQRFLLSV